MEKPISEGDLVRVFRSHCQGFEKEAGGVMFVVEKIRVLRNPWCWHCQTRIPSEAAAESGEWSIPLQFLRRVPPLDELEGEKRTEELVA